MIRAFCTSLLVLSLVSCSTTTSSVGGGARAKVSTKEYPRVAIVAVDSDSLIATFQDSIESVFMNMGFDVIDRANLDKIMAEHKIQRSGVTDDATTKELGKILGVNALVFVKHKTRDKEYTDSASIKMVNIETGSTLLNAKYTFAWGFMKTPAAVAGYLEDEIKKQVTNK